MTASINYVERIKALNPVALGAFTISEQRCKGPTNIFQVTILILLLFCLTFPAQAFEAQEPSPVEAQRLIQMAQSQKTADGTTVIETLRYAEKMRPNVFRLAGPFEFRYSSDGKLSSVGVCYWIGAKRSEGDKYCDISWDIAANHSSLIQPSANPGGTAAELMGGRDVFLQGLDLFYKGNCIDPDTHKKYC